MGSSSYTFSSVFQLLLAGCVLSSVVVETLAQNGNSGCDDGADSDGLSSKGQPCATFGELKKCADTDENGQPLSCQFYSPPGDNIASSQVCVSVAKNGEECNGNSFAQCTPPFPTTGRCESGKCIVDSSASPPCAPEQQVITVLNPRNTSQRVPVCVNYQVDVGGKCQVAAPIIQGGVYQSLRCKEGLVCQQPPNPARFNVDGTCAQGGAQQPSQAPATCQSAAQCLPPFPTTGRCENGKCIVDSSASPPCAPEQQVITVLNPRDTSQRVPVCVNYQVDVGGKCQVAAPIMQGGVYQSLRCKEGLVCQQPPNPARFNVDGTCATQGN